MARRVGAVLTAVLVIGGVVWAAVLRPTSLGGSTTYVVVSGDSMLPTYRSGDLVVAQADASGAAPAVGSVIVYRIPPGLPGQGRLIIHRVVAHDATTGYTTRGDNNSYLDIWHPTPADIVGLPVAVLPGAGRAVAFVRQPLVVAGVAAILAMLWLARGRRKQDLPARPIPDPGDPRRAPDVGYTPA
jgi:signal peptidase